MAQIRALLRRAGNDHQENNSSFTKHGLEIDFEKRIVTVEGREIYFTPTEYNLITILASNAEKTFEYKDLVKAVWGQEYTDQKVSIHTFISQIRHKIEQDPRHPKFIQTIPRIGYRFHNYGF